VAVFVCAIGSTVILVTRPAFAGPPLVCFPFDIGHARSLPIVSTGYGAIDPVYDASRLTADTLDLLDPRSPVVQVVTAAAGKDVLLSRNLAGHISGAER